jgi:hypothetical protein
MVSYSSFYLLIFIETSCSSSDDEEGQHDKVREFASPHLTSRVQAEDVGEASDASSAV